MTDVRRERIPLLWSTVRERVSTNGFCLNMGNTKYPGFCRRTKLSGRGVHGEKARELSRKHMNEHTVIHLAESTHTNTHTSYKLNFTVCIGKYPTSQKGTTKRVDFVGCLSQ